MIISFFEEFPTKENLDKIKLIDFKTKLYIASNSVVLFNRIREKIKSKKVKEIIYWPLLTFKEGYWMSPFSKGKALERIMKETKNINILWDAELPKKRSLILTNLIQFPKNKKLIRNFFKKHKGKIYTAEHFPEKGLFYHLMKFLGLTFNPNIYNNKMIKMIYTSMHNYKEDFIKKEIKYGIRNFKNNFLVALGTIDTGILGNEPILSPKQLERDLKICKKFGVKEVIIFRLGGLNKEYVKILKKYSFS